MCVDFIFCASRRVVDSVELTWVKSTLQALTRRQAPATVIPFLCFKSIVIHKALHLQCVFTFLSNNKYIEKINNNKYLIRFQKPTYKKLSILNVGVSEFFKNIPSHWWFNSIQRIIPIHFFSLLTGSSLPFAKSLSKEKLSHSFSVAVISWGCQVLEHKAKVTCKLYYIQKNSKKQEKHTVAAT